MMTTQEAMGILAAHRDNRIVISTMSTISIWSTFSDTPLDFAYIPSAMGQAPTLGLGLALAQPHHGVIVINGEGSLLMNLGCLVTLAAQPAPLFLVILDNGHYEVTGGQDTAGTGRADFAAMAQGAGIARVYTFDSCSEWEQSAKETLEGNGPVVIWLRVIGRKNQQTPAPPRSMPEQLARLKHALRH